MYNMYMAHNNLYLSLSIYIYIYIYIIIIIMLTNIMTIIIIVMNIIVTNSVINRKSWPMAQWSPPTRSEK